MTSVTVLGLLAAFCTTAAYLPQVNFVSNYKYRNFSRNKISDYCYINLRIRIL